MRKLVLFDIDGTLLSTDGTAGRCFEAALIEVFGTAGPIKETSFAGKTDPQIAHELMAGAGLARAKVESRLTELWAAYLERLGPALAQAPVRVCAGVESCLSEVQSRPDHLIMGLLTGNIEAGARHKLDAAGIGFDRFRVGVFGSDAENRNDLPAIAMRRAEKILAARYRASDMVIVGDTPADVACGAAFGARTVAVATGTYSFDALRACDPDFLFESLADPDAVQAIVE